MLPSQEALVVDNLAMAAREARRWRHVPIEQEDLAADGVLGLIRAAKRFDPRRGVPFAVFALMFVRGAILETIRTRVRSRTLRDGGFVQEFSFETVPGDDDLRSYDPPDTRPAPDEMVEMLDRLRVLGTIPAGERHALIRTQVDGASSDEVARELGVSQRRVHALTSTGSRRLRRRAAW